MEYAYMGLFSAIFNWIFDKILSPVLNFISGLLETVLGWIFNNVLGPLLQAVLWPIIEGTIKLILEVLSGVLYSIFADLLVLINSMQNAFDFFSGVKEVTVQQANGGSYRATLLMALFRQPAVQKAFLIILIFSIFLCLTLSVLAVARASVDMDGERHRNVSRVMKSTAEAVFRFLLIQFSCLFVLLLGGAVLNAVKVANQYSVIQEIGGNEKADIRISNILFVISSLDAAKPGTPDRNLSDLNKEDSSAEAISILSGNRGKFYRGLLDPTKKSDVEPYFKLSKIDYLIGYGMGLFFVVVLGVALCKFMTRIFEVLLLFIVSPFFVAMMPLDDGEKLRGWQDLFVGKIFSGYGMVIAMQIYLILCPYVMSGNVIFGKTSAEGDYLIKLLFIAGGAFAILKAGSTMTSLMSQAAGMREMETGMVTQSMLSGAGAYVGRSAMRAAGSAFRGHSGKKQSTAARQTGTHTAEHGMQTGQRFDGGPAVSGSSGGRFDGRVRGGHIGERSAGEPRSSTAKERRNSV